MTIHPKDYLYQQMVRTRGKERAVEGYFKGGEANAQRIKRIIEALESEKPTLRILDFAAGYGRVTRYLRELVAQHILVASDIHPEACQFITEQFGVPALVSAQEPENLAVGDNYDLIFVLSLFSHLPDHSFGRWLGALYGRLAPGGILMFTANGATTLAKGPKAFAIVFDEAKGFGFLRNSDQPDIPRASYGSMVVSKQYVSQAIEKYAPGAELYRFEPGSWLGVQDGWFLKRP